MLIMPSFKKSLLVEQFQGNYLNQPKPTFVCCFGFVRAFSFQGHTKIALTWRKTKYMRM